MFYFLKYCKIFYSANVFFMVMYTFFSNWCIIIILTVILFEKNIYMYIFRHTYTHSCIKNKIIPNIHYGIE